MMDGMRFVLGGGRLQGAALLDVGIVHSGVE